MSEREATGSREDCGVPGPGSTPVSRNRGPSPQICPWISFLAPLWLAGLLILILAGVASSPFCRPNRAAFFVGETRATTRRSPRGGGDRHAPRCPARNRRFPIRDEPIGPPFRDSSDSRLPL